MSNETAAPQGNPGDIVNWPMLKIVYRTDPDKIAALLPPGIEPGANPNVNLTIYNFPVPDEPEFGIVTSVDARFNGVEGEYTLGYGIDQESAIFVSPEASRTVSIVTISVAISYASTIVLTTAHCCRSLRPKYARSGLNTSKSL